MKIITRAEAKAQGLDRYFTGKPCKHGHVSERRVINLCCMQCDSERSKAYRERNRDSVLAKQRGRRQENIEAERRREQSYSERNRDLRRSYGQQYRETHKEYFTEYSRTYYRENKRRILDNNNLSARRRRSSDPNFRMMESMRKMLARVLAASGSERPGKTESTVGYTRGDLVFHIESQFREGMTWANYGEWHIDHKTPIDHFIKRGERDPAVINALSNLQPLWAAENLSKGNRMPNGGHQ